MQKQAKQKRVEYLKQQGSPYGSVRGSSVKSGEFLSRKLARYHLIVHPAIFKELSDLHV
jgi:hypothetical protein